MDPPVWEPPAQGPLVVGKTPNRSVCRQYFWQVCMSDDDLNTYSKTLKPPKNTKRKSGDLGIPFSIDLVVYDIIFKAAQAQAQPSMVCFFCL